MLPYYIIFVLLIFNAFFNRKDAKQFNLITFLLFSLFYILRNNIGGDWLVYENYFNHISDYSIVDNLEFEPLYRLLNIVGASIFPSFRWIILIVGTINCYLFWNSTNKYTKNMGIAILLSSFYMFYPTLEAFRQSITLFIFYFSLRYIEDSNKKYIILNLVGLLFHRTGIFGIVFLLFYKYPKMKKIIIGGMALFYLIEPYFILLLQKVPTLYEKYYWYFIFNREDLSILSFKSIEYLLLISLFHYYSKKQKLNFMELISKNLLLLGFFIQITFGRFSNIFYRLTYYSDIGIIFAYVFIYNKTKNYAIRFIYIVILIIYIIIRFYRVFPFNDPRFYYTL